MNGINTLLDTNIIIGLLKGNSQAIELLNNIHLSACAFSAITRMELLSYPNLNTEEERAINQILANMTRLTISPLIEDLTIQFRHAHRVKLPDAIIAATATAHNLKLLTLDKKLAIKL
ncbi:MAG: PIN domain-containing protein [Methylococcales bacterium]